MQRVPAASACCTPFARPCVFFHPARPLCCIPPSLHSPQVRREIKKADNSSTWRLNGRDSRLKEVEELVRDKLKVQLDNLCQVGAAHGGVLPGWALLVWVCRLSAATPCLSLLCGTSLASEVYHQIAARSRQPLPPQFLPQDKVVEFARMKPVDLLEATEKVPPPGPHPRGHVVVHEVCGARSDACCSCPVPYRVEVFPEDIGAPSASPLGEGARHSNAALIGATEFARTA